MISSVFDFFSGLVQIRQCPGLGRRRVARRGGSCQAKGEVLPLRRVGCSVAWKAALPAFGGSSLLSGETGSPATYAVVVSRGRRRWENRDLRKFFPLPSERKSVPRCDGVYRSDEGGDLRFAPDGTLMGRQAGLVERSRRCPPPLGPLRSPTTKERLASFERRGKCRTRRGGAARRRLRAWRRNRRWLGRPGSGSTHGWRAFCESPS